MISWWVIWLVIAIIMLIVEVVTTGLTTLWFALGAIVAMVMDLCGAPLTSQIVDLDKTQTGVTSQEECPEDQRRQAHRKRRSGNRTSERC